MTLDCQTKLNISQNLWENLDWFRLMLDLFQLNFVFRFCLIFNSKMRNWNQIKLCTAQYAALWKSHQSGYTRINGVLESSSSILQQARRNHSINLNIRKNWGRLVIKWPILIMKAWFILILLCLNFQKNVWLHRKKLLNLLKKL